MRRNRWL
jgi:hypothetical protein